MNNGPLDWSGWLLRVLTWDGMVPVSLLLLSRGLVLLAGNQAAIIDVLCVFIPLTGLLVRLNIGRRTIHLNDCSRGMKGVQFWFLVFGLLVLAFLECVMMLFTILPPPPDPAKGWIVFGVALGMYFPLMIIAMYPGQQPTTPRDEEYTD